MAHSIELDALLAPEGNENAYYIGRMRQWRDILLSQSDWTQMADSPLSETKRNEWKVYRQALRDFPSTFETSDTADFPDMPS